MAAADGPSDSAIARALAINRKTVTLWRARYAAGGLESLWEVAPGRGRKPRYGPEKIEQIVEATLQTTPPGMPHWSCRVMAQRHGVSKSTISNIWRSHNLKPHLRETFKLSRDPRFLEKLTDVVGLYLNPPQHALVLCVDEKSQIQALDRTQPGLPLKKGRCGTMTHDYKRHGTTTLFAALDVLQGKVIGQCTRDTGIKSLCDSFAVWITSFPAKRPYTLCWTTMAPTTIRGESLAPPATVRSALCADQCELAQSRGVVRRTHVETDPPRSDCGH